VAVAEVAAVEVGVGVGCAVVGGFVGRGVTVCCGVAVRRGDGVSVGVGVGVGEWCGVRCGTGRFVCEGVGVGELECCAGGGESLAVLDSGGLTHA
jgi:hypothetical protein